MRNSATASKRRGPAVNVALVLMGLAIVTLRAIESSPQTSGDFYYFDGAPVPLVRSETEVVVRFADPTDAVTRLARQSPGLLRTLQAGTPSRRFDVLSLAAPLTRAGQPQPARPAGEAAAQLLETVRQDPNVVFAAPVYRNGRGGIRVLPTDELVVRLKPGDTEQDLVNIIDGLGLTIDRPLDDTTDRFVLRMTNGKGPTALDLSRTLHESGRLAWAEPNFIQQYRQFDIPNDPRYANQWHLKNTGQGGGIVGADSKLEPAWDIEDGNGSIVIAVLDDAIDKVHEDLAATMFVNPGEIPANGVDDDGNGKIDDVSGWDFKNGDNNPNITANDSHGTGAAGVAAARGNNGIGVTGACRQCQLLSVKIFENQVGVDDATNANAITYAARFADIINASWGSGVQSAAIQSAIATANTTGRGGKGVLSFFSSGNYASGIPFEPIQLLMSAGTYGFRFVYTKNGAGAAGDDTSWLSWVTFPGLGGTTFTNGIPAGWTTGGNQPWTVVTDPWHSDESLCLTKAAKPGTIGNNQTSYLQVYKTIAAGNVVINQWTSSEANADGLKIQVDYFNNGTFFDTGFFATGIPGDAASYTQNAATAPVLYPAAYPEAIAVGASSNADCRSYYSQFGPQLAFLAPSSGGYYNMSVESTDQMGAAGAESGNYMVASQQNASGFSGTSSASPFAAGIAALILSRSPNLTRAKVLDILKNSADKVGPEPYVAGRNDRYGHGRLNAYQALLDTPVPPGAPTNAVATPGNGQASVSFVAPASTGGSAITSYTVTSSPGGFTSSGATSPRVVSGLTNGVSYTFTVAAANEAGTGAASAPSNSVMPSGGGAPGAFSKTSPANADVAQPQTIQLVWGTSATATSYEYCLDTSNNSACDTGWVSAGASTNAIVGGLLANTTYYWHARSSSAGGTTYSDASTTAYRSFTTTKSKRVDLNGDGNGDAFTYSSSTGAYAMQASLAGGGFTTPGIGSWAPGWSVVPAHFNADGMTDFFLSNPGTGQWFKMLNTGTGFTTESTSSWWPGWQKFVLELNGDGISDLFLYDPATGQWFKCLSTPGGFTYLSGYWSTNWEITVMNLNRDAFSDLFLMNRSTGQWYWVLGETGGGFTYPQSAYWATDWAFYTGDFNGDGLGDLFLYRAAAGQYYVAFNNGAGFTYTAGYGWAAGWTPYVGDFDGNGKDDLFLHNASSGQWYEMIGDGAGTFSSAGGQVWSLGWQLHTLDLNGDKRTDFLLYNSSTGAWYQARNLALGTFSYNNGAWTSGLTIIIKPPSS